MMGINFLLPTRSRPHVLLQESHLFSEMILRSERSTRNATNQVYTSWVHLVKKIAKRTASNARIDADKICLSS